MRLSRCTCLLAFECDGEVTAHATTTVPNLLHPDEEHDGVGIY